MTKGVVLEMLNDRDHRVLTEDYGEVICSLSSKTKSRLAYDIQLGEYVQVEVSPYDDEKGRIEIRGWERTSTLPT
ncbi:MAG: translation initiation factor IF-1 [Neolewinella sp.]|jgi:translation initiation factor IF-1